jgi:hypothetical protein
MRMTAGVDLRQRLDVDVGVDLGGFEAGVAQHFLHEADVRTIAVHVSCHRVPLMPSTA